MIEINSWKKLIVKHFKTFRKVDLFEPFFFQIECFRKVLPFFQRSHVIRKPFYKV